MADDTWTMCKEPMSNALCLCPMFLVASVVRERPLRQAGWSGANASRDLRRASGGRADPDQAFRMHGAGMGGQIAEFQNRASALAGDLDAEAGRNGHESSIGRL